MYVSTENKIISSISIDCWCKNDISIAITFYFGQKQGVTVKKTG